MTSLSIPPLPSLVEMEAVFTEICETFTCDITSNVNLSSLV